MPLHTIGENIRLKTGSAPSKTGSAPSKTGRIFFCPAAFFRLTTKKFPVKMPCGRRNFCSRFVPGATRPHLFFHRRFFLLTRPLDPAIIGVTAPKTAWRRFQQIRARLSREKIKNSARLGRLIKDIMLNEKTHSNQSLRGARIDKWYYVKYGSARIRYIITQKKPSKIKDLGKSFEIKDLANPLILKEKIFSFKINNLAETAFLRQCKNYKCESYLRRLQCKNDRVSSDFLVSREKIFNPFG